MVYVLNQNGQPLMPTENHTKVRVLLKQGKAKVVNKCPFTIRTHINASVGYKNLKLLKMRSSYLIEQKKVG